MMKYLLLALRSEQWIKNFFVFLPLIFGRKLFVIPENIMSTGAFLIFCIASSAAYISNDVIDIEKDKFHPIKQLRPIASEKIGIKRAQALAFLLSALSITVAFTLNIFFGWIIVFYLVLNLAYSKFLKDIVIIDVFCIAAFFLLRVFAGSIVPDVAISPWIMIMTALLALFLGFSKRRQELCFLEEKAESHRYVLTKYNLYFVDQMIAVITTSIVVAYMLYTIDARTVGELGTRNLMWSIPFVYYGIFRYLYQVHKVREESDPTRMLLSDKMMQLNIVLWLIVCIVIIYFFGNIS